MRFSFLFFLILVGISLPAQAHHAAGHDHDVTVKVNGLVCDFCARNIEKVFGRRAEVSGVGVNLDTHEVNLDFKTGAAMPDDEIKQMITDSGYNVVKITR